MSNTGGSGGGGNLFDAAWFGSSQDPGTITVAPGTYTLLLDAVLPSVLVQSGATWNLAGFVLFCAGVLRIEAGAVLQVRGNDGAGAVAGDGSPPVPTSTSLQGQGLAGGTGAIAAALPGAGVTLSGVNTFASSVYDPYGGAGGAGGDGSATVGGAAGDAVGSVPIPALGEPFTVPRLHVRPWLFDPNSATVQTLFGGQGGGGGGGDGVNSGGGGGGGGGILLIFAKEIINDGVISVRGGDGGNAVGGNCGGGGGGGGGLAILVTNAYSGAGTIDISGGAGGAGTGTGTAGTAGADGQAIVLLPL